MLFAGLLWQTEKVFHVYEKLTTTTKKPWNYE